MKNALATLIALALLCFLAPSCASAPVANRTIENADRVLALWSDARDDGKLSMPEVASLDAALVNLGNSAAELKAAVARSYPPLDSPTDPSQWIEWAAGIIGVGTAAATAHYTVNRSRDKKRRSRGEPVAVPKTA